jgi:multiple sugar transport system permease protein
MIQTSFKTRSAIQDTPLSLIPTQGSFTFSRYEVLIDPIVGRYIINTIIITTGTVILTVVISLLGGYALARFRFKGKVTFARFVLVGYMFSAIVVGLPLFRIWKQLGLVNTYIGMIMVLSATSLPFSVWVMWKFMQTVPESLEESAWVVGASRLQAIKDIVLPQAAPGIIAVSLFSFAIAWNDFTYAEILLPKQEAQTFGPGLLQIVNEGYATSWGDMMAVGTFLTIPPLLFTYFLQSYLLKGFAMR